MQNKLKRADKRKLRIRSRVRGIKSRPRLTVHRSLKHIYAQIIDDEKGITLAASSDLSIKKKTGNKSEVSKEVGLQLAVKAKSKKIKKVVFDRGSYKFHGRVKAVADGAKEGGLEF